MASREILGVGAPLGNCLKILCKGQIVLLWVARRPLPPGAEGTRGSDFRAQVFVKPLSEHVACLIPLVASRPGRMTSGPPTPGKFPDDGTILVFMRILRQSPAAPSLRAVQNRPYKTRHHLAARISVSDTFILPVTTGLRSGG